MNLQQEAEIAANEYAKQFNCQASFEGLENIADDYKQGYIAGYNADRWIDPKNTLPEDHQRILFWVTGQGELYKLRIGMFLSKDQFDRVNMFCDGAFFTTDKVTHWQPLPSPPQPKTM